MDRNNKISNIVDQADHKTWHDRTSSSYQRNKKGNKLPTGMQKRPDCKKLVEVSPEDEDYLKVISEAKLELLSMPCIPKREILEKLKAKPTVCSVEKPSEKTGKNTREEEQLLKPTWIIRRQRVGQALEVASLELKESKTRGGNGSTSEERRNIRSLRICPGPFATCSMWNLPSTSNNLKGEVCSRKQTSKTTTGTKPLPIAKYGTRCEVWSFKVAEMTYETKATSMDYTQVHVSEAPR